MILSSDTKNNCQPCAGKDLAAKRKQRAGFLTGIVLAVLPKCPFCVMAYSSAVMLCTEGAGMHSGIFSSTNILIITILFCAIALASILFNYRDQRSAYAFLLGAIGSTIIILSITITMNLAWYYAGIALLFAGIWLNASLLSLVRKVKQYLQTPSPNNSA